MNRPLLAAAIAASIASRVAGASADEAERQACISAAERGQDEKNQAKLLEARHDLEICARDACPGLVRRDCTQWLEEVEGRMPTIVFVAHDGKGTDVVDARVFVDDAELPGALDGKAHAIDPGTHAVRVEWSSKTTKETVVVHEGEKGRTVLLQLEPLVATPPPPTTTNGPAPKTITVPRPTPTSVYVLGAVGVAATGAFTYFAIKGVYDRNAFHCDTPDGCSSDHYSRVQKEYLAADIALGVAALSFGAAAWVYFTRGESTPPEGSMAIAPTTHGATATWSWSF